MAYDGGYSDGYGDLTYDLAVTVEIAFGSDPGAASPTWTDVTQYLKKFTVHRGRADELAAFSAGQVQMTLSNEDRRFDPTYAAGPYYPNVIPMRRIRIRVTWAGVIYDVFNGYATNWRQLYDPPADAECVLEATDAFKVLGNISLRRSVWAQEIAADSPALWFPLDEPATATSVLDIIGGRSATLADGATPGQAGLVVRDPGSALLLPIGGSANTGVVTAPFTAYPATFSAIIRVGTGFRGTFAQLLDSGGNSVMALNVDFVGGTASVDAATQTNSNRVQGGPSLDDGNPHLVTATWDASGDVRLYTDGALVGGPLGITGTLNPPVRVSIATSAGAAAAVTVDEVVAFPSAVSAARVASWSASRATARSAELTGARVAWILDAAGWPAADRNIDAGTSTLQGADLGSTALAALQEVEQTEFGALFVTADGEVRFISRTSLLSAPYTTSQATFGDSGAELEYGDIEFEYDDKLIYNEAQVSRLDGTIQIASDSASQTKYLRRTKVISGLLQQSDSVSIDAANWIVAHYKDPILRVTGMRLEPSAGNESTHFPQVLGRELMDRVTIVRRPQNLGAAISQPALIQGITHTVTGLEWVTHWDLSPAETQIYWILGTAGFSELDQTTRLGF